MPKILIADPHPDLARLFARMVTRLGHESVADRAAPFDAAIVDVDSPSGRELARTSRQSGRAVVCVGIHPRSSNGPTTGIPEPYLLKPFPLEALARELSHALESRSTLEPA